MSCPTDSTFKQPAARLANAPHPCCFVEARGSLSLHRSPRNEGMARREGASFSRVHAPFPMRGAFRRATRTTSSGLICGVFLLCGPRFAHGALRLASVPDFAAPQGSTAPSEPRANLKRSAVSELLAGTRSGPGRGPGTARVRRLRSPPPAGAAQPSASSAIRPGISRGASPPPSIPPAPPCDVSRRRPSTSKARVIWRAIAAILGLLS